MVGRRPTTGAVRPTTDHLKKNNFFITIEVIKHKTFTFPPLLFFVDTESCRRTAVLSGINAGVQAILRQSYNITKIYVHCFAHWLNLIIYDIPKVVPYLFECYSVVSKIYTCFHSSSVIIECYKSIQQQLVSEKINYLMQHHHVETQFDK